MPDEINVNIGDNKILVEIAEDTPINVNLENATQGVNSFVELTDVPGSYSGKSNKIVAVKSDETGLSFRDEDKGSTAVATHESTYNHSLLHQAVTIQDTSTIDLNLSGQQISADVKESGLSLGSLGEKSYNSLTDKPTIPASHTQLSDIGTNTHAQIDTALSSLVPKTTQVNGHALNADVNVTKSDIGLGNVANVDQTNPSNISQDSTHRFVTDSEKTQWNAATIPAFTDLTDTPNNYTGQGGKAVYVKGDETGLQFQTAVSSDEKVKYDAADPTAGYLSEKVVAGTGITISEGTGADENKLKITNSSPGVTDHSALSNLDFPHAGHTGSLKTVQTPEYTGTGTASGSGSTITGIGTKFLTECVIGAKFRNNVIAGRTITAISSDTSMTTDTPVGTFTARTFLITLPAYNFFSNSTNWVARYLPNENINWFSGGIGVNSLNVNRVLYTTTGGQIIESGNLTFDGANLGVGGGTVTTKTVVLKPDATGANLNFNTANTNTNPPIYPISSWQGDGSVDGPKRGSSTGQPGWKFRDMVRVYTKDTGGTYQERWMPDFSFHCGTDCSCNIECSCNTDVHCGCNSNTVSCSCNADYDGGCGLNCMCNIECSCNTNFGCGTNCTCNNDCGGHCYIDGDPCSCNTDVCSNLLCNCNANCACNADCNCNTDACAANCGCNGNCVCNVDFCGVDLCACNSDATACSCNTDVCAVNCGVDPCAPDCACNADCSCNTDSPHCGINCSCNIDSGCGCNTNTGGCTCNIDCGVACNVDCQCNVECACNVDAGCGCDTNTINCVCNLNCADG